MVISIAGVSKSYKSVRVVDNISMDVARGDYFGLLGENGSGKSTLISVLLGLTAPDKGSSVHLFDMPVRFGRGASFRERVGVVGEAAQLNDDRTVWTYLDFFARLYGLDERNARIASGLEEVGLFDAREKTIRTLSRGMKQRLALCRALLHDPELLILDEPINGLDPQGIHDIRELLDRKHRGGKTIFLCSHLLSEVERSCTRIAVIHKGRLLVCGGTAEIAGGDLEAAYLQLLGAAKAGVQIEQKEIPCPAE